MALRSATVGRLSPAFLLCLVLAADVNAQSQLVTAAQWQSDIDYLASQLPKVHPNPFTHTSRQEFTAQLEALKARVPQLTDVAIAILMQQAVASLADAHTEVDARISPNTYYPVRVDRLSDGFYVTRTGSESKAACGAKLVAIDGVAVDDVLARVSTVISHENDQWVLARAPGAMARAEVLETLGITSSSSSATFTFERGTLRFDLDLHPVSGSEANAILSPPSSTVGWPLYMQQASRNYWYSWDPGRGVMYVKYNVCQNDPARPFSAFASEIFGIVDRSSVSFFVVDLRNNGGGNSSVAQPLINGLRQRTQLRGRTYVIIGRGTFSSGLLNALDLRGVGALVVGEPTGGKPNGYGEVQSFTLPSSRLAVFHSTRYFSLVPGDPASMDPDIGVTTSGAEFFARRDPVLEVIVGGENARSDEAPAATARRRAVRPFELRTCPE